MAFQYDELVPQSLRRCVFTPFSSVGEIEWSSRDARRGVYIICIAGGVMAFLPSWTLEAIVGIVGLVFYGAWSRWNLDGLGLRASPLQGWTYWALVSIALGLAVVAVSFSTWLVCLCLGVRCFVPQIDPSAQAAQRWAAYALLFAPVLEELVYRFVLCVPMARRLGPARTILVSGGFFALAHFTSGHPGPDNFVAGFILAWAFLKSGTLLVPILLHFAGNLCVFVFGIIMFYWPVFVIEPTP